YVRESLIRPNGMAFLRAMASLCRDLGIQTIGEMIETEDVAAFLRDVGVRFGQGYLFGRPAAGVRGVGRRAAH
ncbi:MAG TPA: EAL domain-containing protein, partial [Dongiaceae bacterium]|nr:EAL domain-containing protein [Dongiaceae bacterium]